MLLTTIALGMKSRGPVCKKHTHAFSFGIVTPPWNCIPHYNDVILSTMASQITSLTIVYASVYSCTDQRKHQSSASLAFGRVIYQWPVSIWRRHHVLSRNTSPQMSESFIHSIVNFSVTWKSFLSELLFSVFIDVIWSIKQYICKSLYF